MSGETEPSDKANDLVLSGYPPGLLIIGKHNSHATFNPSRIFKNEYLLMSEYI